MNTIDTKAKLRELRLLIHNDYSKLQQLKRAGDRYPTHSGVYPIIGNSGGMNKPSYRDMIDTGFKADRANGIRVDYISEVMDENKERFDDMKELNIKIDYLSTEISNLEQDLELKCTLDDLGI